MKLQEKMNKLSEKMVKIMNKHFKKDKISVRKNWHKDIIYYCLCLRNSKSNKDNSQCSSIMEDTFLVFYNKRTKALYSSVVIFNDNDTYNSHKGQQLALKRMCQNTDFINSVREMYTYMNLIDAFASLRRVS